MKTQAEYDADRADRIAATFAAGVVPDDLREAARDYRALAAELDLCADLLAETIRMVRG
jgi:hypothetical protein